MEIEKQLELTEEQRAEVQRRDAKIKLVGIGFGMVTAVAAMFIERKLNNKLIADFTTPVVVIEETEEDN